MSFDGTQSDAINEETISSLVRLALASEVSKRPLRREDINNFILNDIGTRHFKELLAATNQRLHDVFGMQLVPLPVSSKPMSTLTVAGRKAATIKKTEPSSGGTSYILTSIKERSVGNYHRRFDKLAVLAIILTMIALERNELEEETLLRQLLKLGIAENDQVFGSLSEWVSELKRQKYLVTSRKNDDLNVLIYSAGPRAMVEFPLEVLAKFVLEVGSFVQQTFQLEEKIHAALGLQINHERIGP